MALSTLNLDILTHVLSYIVNANNLSQASRTCRALHRVGVVQLLKRHAFISRNKDLESFLAFITADDWRPRLIKELTLSLTGSLGEDAALVAQILTRCTSVEELDIDAYLLDEDLQIGAAFVGLQHIRKLILNDARGVVNLGPFLVSMRSRCNEVDIGFVYPRNTAEDDDTDDDAEWDPILMLLASALSLQTLRAARPYFGSMTVQYPQLTTLEIERWDELNIEPLLYAFPNLHHLILDDCGSFEHPAVLREANRVSFLRNPWIKLDHVACPVHVFYTLGLAYTIRRCRITEPMFSAHEYETFLAAVKELQPAELYLCWSGRLDMKDTFDKLHLTCASRLTRLTVEIIDFDSYSAVEIDDMLDDFVNLVGRLNLTHIEMTMACPPSSNLLEGPEHELRLHVKSLDHRLLASRLMNAAPNLKQLRLDIGVGLSYLEEENCCILFIEGEGANRHAVRVTQDTFEEFKRREGMEDHSSLTHYYG